MGGSDQAFGYRQALDFDHFYQSLHCLRLVFGAWGSKNFGFVIMVGPSQNLLWTHS